MAGFNSAPKLIRRRALIFGGSNVDGANGRSMHGIVSITCQNSSSLERPHFY